MVPMHTTAVLLELAVERERQIADGRTVEQDDKHGLAEWAWLLSRRVSDLQCPWVEAVNDDPRRSLVEIAAIAVAAVESFDRQAVVHRDPVS